MPVTSPVYLRMKQAVQWLKHEKQMLQKDIAEKMGMTDVSFSRGMERIKHKFDEDFIISFHQATGEIFSLDWLLNGTGDKFAEKIKPQERQPAAPSLDTSSYLNALLAKTDETIASLKRELATKDEIIAVKDERIADLAKLAEERLHRIAELRRIIDANSLSIAGYPFTTGVAEGPTDKNRK